MDFRGFLNNIEDWDHLSKPQESKKTVSRRNAGKVNESKEPPRKIPTIEDKENSRATSKLSSKDYDIQYNYMRYHDATSHKSGSLLDDESPPNAASEKELGNEYFKQKKFHEAIECYSRSIALSPTSVTFANRAMAYLKVKRFEEAENDCTEALNLDDRNVKAYSRRSTARKELGKLKLSLEDADLAVRLEPNNKELRKQYTETKALYEKETTKKIAGTSKYSNQGIQKERNIEMRATDVPGVQVSSNHVQKESNGKISCATRSAVEEAENRVVNMGNKARVELLDEPPESASLNSTASQSKKLHGANHDIDMKDSVQDLASRAASLVTATAGKNITTPNSAYQFEVSWRALSDDLTLQSQLLKTIKPSDLPQIFKNALSAPMLIDIVKCTASFFREETGLAVSILENLAKVPRFDMIVMCLSSVDRSELRRLWDKVFTSRDIPAENVEALEGLRPKYCFGEWQTHILGSNAWPKGT